MVLIRGKAARFIRRYRWTTFTVVTAIALFAGYILNRELFHKHFELLVGPIFDHIVDLFTENHGEDA